MNLKKIEQYLWAQRNLAHQIGLNAEALLIALGLMKDEQRIFISKKERDFLDKSETSG